MGTRWNHLSEPGDFRVRVPTKYVWYKNTKNVFELLSAFRAMNYHIMGLFCYFIM